ncbi:protein phosphatase 2A A subunit (ISS) [Metarhizium album ARSEF 1941]|uniref:Protein phosphatase 2A A subunit (ISS) n=1 Tax=Metarhizium album (strain ARSEF 1941) TaxID=1081103 RepID=A0A0B2X3F9_METAS|nr:protein phosphatase 2A A subunit (ISS) [Metarhizium album ARSEF 1941]KHO00248.1 protein phosphatase 2A A subunit (ISS) [Metarhizium album ARSEF 1941]
MPSSRHDQAPLNVIIPIGGNGTRFSEKGYRYPKPLINIVGRPMLLWIIDHLSLRPCDTLWVAINKEVDDNFQVGQLLAKSYTKLDVRLVRLLHQTKGAAETLYVTTQGMQVEHLHRRTVSLDCDTIYWTDVLQLVRDLPAHCGSCIYFPDNGDRPIYSYIKTKNEYAVPASTFNSVPLSDQSRDGLERIVDIQEKTAISDKANTGAYVFPSARQLQAWAAEYLDRPEHLNPDFAEYFTSRLVGLMLENGIPFLGVPVNEQDFNVVGTPEQLTSFLARAKSGSLPSRLPQRKSRFCFDLDMTLVGAPAIAGDYSTCPPIEANIKLVQQLYRAGHHIIIQTARRMRTHHGNVGAVIADVGSTTLQQLARYNIPFHDVHFGKPYADVYVDDLAVNSNLDTIQEVGWLLDEPDDSSAHQVGKVGTGMVAARDFNTIQIINNQVIKSSKCDHILGELFFYSRVPPGIARYFPSIYSVDYIKDTSTYVIQMENCPGLTFSHLLAGRSITKGRLHLFLTTLNKIHMAEAPSAETLEISPALKEEFEKHGPESPDAEPDMYANYGQKLRRRYKENADRYAGLGPLAADLFGRIEEFLDKYEAEKTAVPAGVIHGDPVFSNAILSADGKAVRFLDVRCRLGNVLTTTGDVNYDLAKVLQSLCGYDHVVLGCQGNFKDAHESAHEDYPVLTESDRALLGGLREQFFRFVEETYPGSPPPKTLYGLAAALFFSLIPLHRAALGKVFLNLCKETWDRATDGPDC